MNERMDVWTYSRYSFYCGLFWGAWQYWGWSNVWTAAAFWHINKRSRRANQPMMSHHATCATTPPTSKPCSKTRLKMRNKCSLYSLYRFPVQIYIHNLKRIMYVFNLGNAALNNIVESNVTRWLWITIIPQRISAGFRATQVYVRSKDRPCGTYQRQNYTDKILLRLLWFSLSITVL